MRVHVTFLTPDREEPAYGLEFEMPSVPAPDDLISIQRPGQEGASEFLVCRRTWHLDHRLSGSARAANDALVGTTNSATIECEFVVGSLASEEHKPVTGA